MMKGHCSVYNVRSQQLHHDLTMFKARLHCALQSLCQ